MTRTIHVLRLVPYIVDTQLTGQLTAVTGDATDQTDEQEEPNPGYISCNGACF
jgi:hypothetical protein